MNNIYKSLAMFLSGIFLCSCVTPVPPFDPRAIPQYSGLDSITHFNNLLELNEQLVKRQIFLKVNAPDELKITDSLDEIGLTFINLSDSSYFIVNPELHVNTSYSIHNGKDYYPGILYCPPVKMYPDYILLKAKDSVEFKYSRLIAYSFIGSREVKKGDYNLDFSYGGFFKTKDGKYKLKYVDLESNAKKLSIK